MNNNAVLNDKECQIEKMITLRQNWRWLLALGILLIILSSASIALPQVEVLTIETLLGWLLVFGGVAQAIHASKSRNWGEFLPELLISILYLTIGILLLAYPLKDVLTLTLFLAAFLIVEGIFKAVIALRLRRSKNWEWLLLSGIVALLIGLLLWIEWPDAAGWAIGLLVGIDLLFHGCSLVMMAVAARHSPT